ncbi:endonuclease/exonuclease/phosphatase family protein [Candidatus Marinimicrobia bacterium]|nr:endonuclease/exonuclease/phosphatase family protein [Candidatus Neomarinimicrobiota bacterium]
MRLINLYIFFQILISSEISIDLITTNDIHGVLQEQTAYFMNPQYPPTIIGASALFNYMEELKKVSDQDLLLLDGGNFFQGSNFGMHDKGQSMIEWMNMLNYDAVVPGQYDFILGSKNLQNIFKSANFEVLGSNFDCLDCFPNVKPFIIKEISGVKIAILGIVNAEINDLVPESKLGELSFYNEAKALKKWIPEIKKVGADVIIVLTSSGVPWDREKVYQKFIENEDKDSMSSYNAIELGYYADEVDLIISGGISKGYNTAWYDPNSHVYTIQNYGNGTSFGHIKLKIDSEYKKFIGIEYVNNNQASHTLFSDDFRPDKKATQWINKKMDNIESVNFELDNPIKYINDEQNDWDISSINTEDGLEIITWNCEFFPAANDSTILALSEAVKDLDADIIAFQEIKRAGWFEKLMQRLPEYDYIISLQASFMDLATIYKKDQFIFKNHQELFSDNDYNFAGRPPLKLDLTHINSNKDFSVINLHMKCCDSGLKRRKKAVKMLYDYVSIEYDNNNKNFIVLGDWNDDLKDKPEQHCFDPFLNDEKFYFSNESIVYDISQASYPKEPYISFLDHILVSRNFVKKSSINKVMTIPMDTYMKGFDVYEAYISDHKPVFLSFKLD